MDDLVKNIHQGKNFDRVAHLERCLLLARELDLLSRSWVTYEAATLIWRAVKAEKEGHE